MYYKIVRNNNGQVGGDDGCNKGTSIGLMSAFVYNNSVFNCMYVPGEWAHAKTELLEKGFGLCVFDNLKDASSWYSGQDCPCACEIWECEIEPMPENIMACDKRIGAFTIQRATLDNVSQFIEKIKNRFFVSGWYCWPNGTVMAKSVKLTKRIK